MYMAIQTREKIMKIVVLIGDGMGDYPLAELGGKTPLQHAAIPNIRSIAGAGEVRLVSTVPDGMPPGSDVANLSIMGFDPRQYYTGRAPIEAAGAGVALKPSDVAFRCNLITVTDGLIQDHSAGHIGTPEARRLIEALAAQLAQNGLRFVTGSSYRHLLIWPDGPVDLVTTPPHDVLGQAVRRHLPRGRRHAEVERLMTASKPILADHPVNRARLKAGHNPATQIWLWGQGRKTSLPSYRELYGLSGGVITAVDLVRGIGRLAGLEAPAVPGATGFTDTNYAGKVSAALQVLAERDFVFVHVEAPDECGHMGDLNLKLQAIEAFDREIVGPIWKNLQKSGQPYRLIVGTDHRTPVSVRNHTSEPVPMVVLEGPTGITDVQKPFDEFVADDKTAGMAFEWLKQILTKKAPIGSTRISSMKNACLIVLLSALTLSGCATLNDSTTAAVRENEDFLILRQDLTKLQGRVESIELENQRLLNETEKMRALLSASKEQYSASERRLDDWERRLQALDAAREKDRQAIIDQLSAKMAGILSGGGKTGAGKQAPVAASATGNEHIVKAGENLSTIAAAYKVKTSALIEANHLTNADVLQTGQKLIIPQP